MKLKMQANKMSYWIERIFLEYASTPVGTVRIKLIEEAMKAREAYLQAREKAEKNESR